MGQEIGKQAQKAAEKISETTEQITDTVTYKKVSQVKYLNLNKTRIFRFSDFFFKRLSSIKEEVGDATKLTRQLGYRPPIVLRKRSDTESVRKEKIFQADTYVYHSTFLQFFLLCLNFYLYFKRNTNNNCSQRFTMVSKLAKF